jgi:hypothetical protein
MAIADIVSCPQHFCFAIESRIRRHSQDWTPLP